LFLQFVLKSLYRYTAFATNYLARFYIGYAMLLFLHVGHLQLFVVVVIEPFL
jgi:hypothetical protein